MDPARGYSVGRVSFRRRALRDPFGMAAASMRLRRVELASLKMVALGVGHHVTCVKKRCGASSPRRSA